MDLKCGNAMECLHDLWYRHRMVIAIAAYSKIKNEQRGDRKVDLVVEESACMQQLCQYVNCACAIACSGKSPAYNSDIT